MRFSNKYKPAALFCVPQPITMNLPSSKFCKMLSDRGRHIGLLKSVMGTSCLSLMRAISLRKFPSAYNSCTIVSSMLNWVEFVHVVLSFSHSKEYRRSTLPTVTAFLK